jgi:PAS domain S-box-containing protein
MPNSKKKMNDIFDLMTTMSEGVYAVDDDQRIIFWNNAAEELIGTKANEVLGQYCYDVIRGKDEVGCLFCKKLCSNLSKAKNKKPIPNRDLVTLTKKGKSIWLNISFLAVPLNNSERFSILHIFRDVSHQKQVEQFVSHLSIHLGKLSRPGSPKGNPQNDLSARLTPRELQVLKLAGSGHNTRTIAEKLFLSPHTVRNHIQNILKKLHVRSRLEAVSMAFKLRLI